MKLKFKLSFIIVTDEEEANEFDVDKDSLFVCGSLDALGNWNLTKAIEMTPNKGLHVNNNNLNSSSLVFSISNTSTEGSNLNDTDSLLM